MWFLGFLDLKNVILIVKNAKTHSLTQSFRYWVLVPTILILSQKFPFFCICWYIEKFLIHFCSGTDYRFALVPSFKNFLFQVTVSAPVFFSKKIIVVKRFSSPFLVRFKTLIEIIFQNFSNLEFFFKYFARAKNYL